MSSIKKRLERLESQLVAHSYPPRGLDDFYVDMADPESAWFKYLSSFYPEVTDEKH